MAKFSRQALRPVGEDRELDIQQDGFFEYKRRRKSHVWSNEEDSIKHALRPTRRCARTYWDYAKDGDYYLPDLFPPEPSYIGRYGRLHLKYLREHKNGVYTSLLLSGKLNDVLEDVNSTAQERFKTIIKQMAKQQGVTEKLKATDQMKWVGLMNKNCACDDEVVISKINLSVSTAPTSPI